MKNECTANIEHNFTQEMVEKVLEFNEHSQKG